MGKTQKSLLTPCRISTAVRELRKAGVDVRTVVIRSDQVLLSSAQMGDPSEADLDRELANWTSTHG